MKKLIALLALAGFALLALAGCRTEPEAGGRTAPLSSPPFRKPVPPPPPSPMDLAATRRPSPESRQ